MPRITCREASRIVNHALDEHLSPGERMALRAHLKVCRVCRYYLTQMRLLRRAIRRRASGEAQSGAPIGASISNAARERIRVSLKKLDRDP